MGKQMAEVLDPDLLISLPSSEGARLPGSRLLDRIPYVPLAFVGLGLYRAWIELVFVGSFVKFPFEAFAGHDVYDFAMIVVLILGAVFHRALEPLIERGAAFAVTAATMVSGTCLAWLSVAVPSLAASVALPATVLGGIGTAFIILLWSELYGCLSPFRVGLYYCASIIVAAFVIYFCRGLAYPWLFGTSALLPLASLLLLAIGSMSLTPDERNHVSPRSFSFPWKPTLLMAVYAFAFSLREQSQYASSFGPHSAFGTLFMGILLFVMIHRQGRDFQFATLYRFALPLMTGAFLVLPAFGWFNAQVSDFCAMASYTAFSVLIMMLMASMSYRYGISALWLFGIERGVRAAVSLVGRQASEGIMSLSGGSDAYGLVIGSITVAMVVVGTVLFMSEKDFFARWGVSFKDDEPEPDESVDHLEERARSEEIAQRYGLSPREVEVAQLLAAGKTGPQVQSELFISKDTVKTHVKHIYRKMGIHSRDELIERWSDGASIG